MLKAVLIGTAGHLHYALDAIADGAPCEIVAMSPGPEGEFREELKRGLMRATMTTTARCWTRRTRIS